MTQVVLPRRHAVGPNEFSDVEANDDAIAEVVNGEIDSENVKTGSLEDMDLKSPNNSTYKTLFSATGNIAKEVAAATYWCVGTGSPTAVAALNPLTAIAVGSGGGVSEIELPPLLNLTATDLAVSSKTTKLQLRAAVLTNSTKPLLTFTVGLYPVTSKGGENGLELTFGTVVTGSTVEIKEPAASTVTRGVTSADFSLPSDGLYALGFVTSAKGTAKMAALVNATVQVRNV